jgi:hypothetical protein
MSDFETRHARTLARMAESDEYRDPTAATQPVRWTTPGLAQVPDWDATAAIRFGYLANVIAYRCVQVLVEDITSLPFRAGRDPGPQPGMSLDHDPTAPLARFLGPAPGGPAPNLSSRKLWAWTIAQRLVTGRHGWELELAGGKGSDIVAMWPLTSAHLRAVPTQSGAGWFSSFEYGRTDQPRHLRTDQVFYGWDPDPLDFRQPHSALQACRYPLAIAVMGDQYAHAFLKNGAVPAAMVITQAFKDERSRRTFRRQWAGKFGGPQNHGRTAFSEVEPADGNGAAGDVTKSIDVKVLGLHQRDAQFLEQHRAALELVAIDLGVPWSRLQAQGHTYDNASEEAKTYWRRVVSICRSFEDEVNNEVAPRLGSEVGWFDLTGVDALKVKPEPTTAKVGAPSMVQAQLITIDEARADYGLPPLPNGAGARLMTTDEILALKGADAGTGEDPGARMVELLERIATRSAPVAVDLEPTPVLEVREVAPVETRAPSAEDIEARRARIWTTAERLAVTLERQWGRAFRRLFTRQQDATVGRLTGKRGRQAERRDVIDPGSVFDESFWRAQTADLAADLYEAVAAAAGARVAEVFGIDFDLDTSEVQEFIQARANQLAGQVTETTYRQITQALADGTAAGEDATALAKRIREVFAEASKNRSVVIARTEVISAFNGSTAQLAAILPDDVVAGQEWIATRDGRTRASHAAVDGEWRRPGSPFDVGGHQLRYPGDPNGPADETVQCRCTLALLTPEDVAERIADAERSVPLVQARAILAMAAAGRFNEAETRQRLRSAA